MAGIISCGCFELSFEIYLTMLIILFRLVPYNEIKIDHGLRDIHTFFKNCFKTISSKVQGQKTESWMDSCSTLITNCIGGFCRFECTVMSSCLQINYDFFGIYLSKDQNAASR